MARILVTGIGTNKATDDKLKIIPTGTVTAYLAGTSTPIDMFATEGAGSPSTIYTDADGAFLFWIDITYANRRIKIQIAKGGYSTVTVDDHQIWIDIKGLVRKVAPVGVDLLLGLDTEDSDNPKKFHVDDVRLWNGFLPGPALTTAVGNWATDEIAATESKRFSFYVAPKAYANLAEAVLVFWPASTDTGVDIDIYSEYGAAGEAYNNHSESDTTTTYNITASQIFELDISGILTGVAGGDYVGVKVTVGAGEPTLYFIGSRIRFE